MSVKQNSGKKAMAGMKKQYTREMQDKSVEEVKGGASLRATLKKYCIPHTTLQN